MRNLLLLFLFFLAPLTSAVLTPNISESGLPLVSQVENIQLIAYDILTRPAVLNLTNDGPSCIVDETFAAWCGGTDPSNPYNYSAYNPYLYCIYTETWPVPNLLAWLQTSYFTPTTEGAAYFKYPFYPSYCACPYPGRAVFTGVPIINYPTYHRECPTEIAALSIIVFLILCFAIHCGFLIPDIVLWVIWLCGSQRKFKIWSSFIPKILILATALLTILSLSLLMASKGSVITPNLYFGQIWTMTFSLVTTIFVYLFWITIFFDMISVVTNMTPTSKKTMGFLRWLVVILSSVLLFGVTTCAVLLYAFGTVLFEAPLSVTGFMEWHDRLNVVISVVSIFPTVAMFVCLAWGTAILFKTLHWIMTGENTFTSKNPLEKELFLYKTIYTVGATVALWCVWGVWIAYVVLIGFSLGAVGYGSYASAYQIGLYPMWLLFSQGFFLLFVLIFLSLATKTHLEDKTYCQVFFSSVNSLRSRGDSPGSSGDSTKGSKVTAGSTAQ